MFEIVSAVAIFFIVYIFIVTEQIHRTIAAMIGATALMFLQVFENPHEVYIKYVDFNTIFLLIGMMLFVEAMKTTGFFQYVGIQGLRVSKGNLKMLFITFTLLVAVISAFIDNVTTVLIFVPMTLAVADAADFDPVPFVIGEIFASNIGGTATLIGDPPNILIGTAAHLTFIDFIKNLAPVSIIIFFVVDFFLLLVYRKEFNKKAENTLREDIYKSFDRKKIILGGVLLGITITLFLFQHKLDIPSSSIALMMGFSSVLIIEKEKVEEFLKGVDWGTIFFFVALFIITGALEETGVLEKIAIFMINLSSGSVQKLKALLISLSAIISAFVDNIPYTATMIPVIESLQKIDPHTYANLEPFWWSLALGACLGGNGTTVGASANVISLQILAQYGKKITFYKFLKLGMTVVAISTLISIIYVLIRY
ncbi:MAG: ArsB/NhaD family transporter [Thermotogaceae bacterium]|nr:ArsB/NhaD family transporter [Thermotogaceae bacterium]